MSFLRYFKRFIYKETGVTLIETLVALAILGAIAVAFLSALTTASRATIIASEQATAESFARSEIEYVKSLDYIDYGTPGHGVYVSSYRHGSQEVVDAGYDIELDIESIDPDTGQPYGPGPPEDEGIQRVTVTITRNGKSVITRDGYKVDR